MTHCVPSAGRCVRVRETTTHVPRRDLFVARFIFKIEAPRDETGHVQFDLAVRRDVSDFLIEANSGDEQKKVNLTIASNFSANMRTQLKNEICINSSVSWHLIILLIHK